MDFEEGEQIDFERMWWQGNDLHFTTKEGKHTIMRNCTIYETTTRIINSEGVVHEETTMEFKAGGRIERMNN